MVTETADEESSEIVRAPKRERWAERTVDLSELEIAAVEAAEMMTPPKRSRAKSPRKLQRTPEE